MFLRAHVAKFYCRLKLDRNVWRHKNFPVFCFGSGCNLFHYGDHALSVVVNFSHFRLLLWNRLTEFNKTRQEAWSQRPIPSLCFSGRSEKQDGYPGLYLAEIFSTSPLKPLNGIQRNLTGSKFVVAWFFCVPEWQWNPQNMTSLATKLDRKQDLNVLYQVYVFRVDRPPGTLIGWDIFDFSEQNSKKLDKKQDLNVLYHVCVFRADLKNKKTTPSSDWPRHFRLLLWNRWMKFNETWQEARSQRPLRSLCFRADRKKNQNGRPGLWFSETFSTSLKPQNRI